MEITIQQKGGDYEGNLDRRNFKLKNGSYENAAYNDGGVPTHYLIVAWMQEPSTSEWDDTKKTWVHFPRSKEVQDYMDKFYPSLSDIQDQHFIVLGSTNDEEPYFESGINPENFTHYLQELAIKLADEKGLIPEYTLLDIFENKYTVSLYGSKSK